MYAIRRYEYINIKDDHPLELITYLCESGFKTMPEIVRHKLKCKWFISSDEAIDFMQEVIMPEYEYSINEMLFEIVHLVTFTNIQEVYENE